MIGLNKEPRLRFTDEERADPALEKPIRKTEKATARADKAQANIPKKKVRQTVIDPDTGKKTSKLTFEDKKKPPSKLSQGVKEAPVHLVAGKFHKEIRETEQDNVGVESAHKSEEAVETGAYLVREGYRSHKLKPYRKLKDRVWNSIAEKEAAYLLLPYTEEIRQSVEQLLDERYQQYLEAEFADDPEERVARAAEGKPAVIPDWDGPLFCYASDRVAQDGCKVQIMDRLFPEREDMGWESGWAFYSGDEGDVYGEGDEYYESHCGFYDIRDICRIDPDIIPLLNLPYGTMQMRGEDGAWYEVIRDDEGEEET